MKGLNEKKEGISPDIFVEIGRNYHATIINTLIIVMALLTFHESITVESDKLDKIVNLLGCIAVLLYSSNSRKLMISESLEESEIQDNQIAVIVTLSTEPMFMVKRTIRSVLAQETRGASFTLVLSDDGASSSDEDRKTEIANLTEEIRSNYPLVNFIYNVPPLRDSEERKGVAKAGNLNSALETLSEVNPKIIFTLDADDFIQGHNYLGRTVNIFNAFGANLGFIQSEKSLIDSRYDGFGNNETFFYKDVLPNRNLNLIAPSCGSGVVYNAEALESIGGFHHEKLLIEDWISGLLINDKGYASIYDGSQSVVAQNYPTDLENYIKQRMRWAESQLSTHKVTNLSNLTTQQRFEVFKLISFYFYPLIFSSLVSMDSLYEGFEFKSSSFLVLNLLVGLRNAPLHNFEETKKYFTSMSSALGMYFFYAKSIFNVISSKSNNQKVEITDKKHNNELNLKLLIPNFVLIMICMIPLISDIFENESVLEIFSNNFGQIVLILMNLYFIRNGLIRRDINWEDFQDVQSDLES